MNMNKIVDLRSDTFTLPDTGMRAAMASAVVGDDVFGEDDTVNHLQNKIASYFGKEAALFVPSGTMGNQLGIRVNTEDGDEVIAEKDAHIFYYETAAPSIISRVQIRTLPSEYGEIPLEELNSARRTSEYYFPKTTLLCLESSHNRHGGYPLSQHYIDLATDWAHQQGLRTHLDGARVWNSIIALNVDPKEYVRGFDTLSVCFSKGLGAPVGSALVGDKVSISKALKWRKILGGGMRQAGILAAGADFGFNHNLTKLSIDHDNTLYLAQALGNNPRVLIDLSTVKTNILRFSIPGIQADQFTYACQDKGIIFMATGVNSYRIVIHHQITREMVERAVDIINNVLASF